MGQILSQPVTEKHSEQGGNARMAYGLSCMQGWRINMEDAHATILKMADIKREGEGGDEASEAAEAAGADDATAFFGVYDGHGGEKAAIFTGQRLHGIIKATAAYQRGDYTQALKDGFLECDQAILRDYGMRDDDLGCAATLCLVTALLIFCGNAGDLRTVMSIDGFAKALSYDHKPLNEGEKARICSAGGYVDMGRVNGNLALLRGIGDFEFKKNAELPAEEQIVTCYPDVLQHSLDLEHDEFIVLACDGIWDCLLSQQCVECVRRGINERKALPQICEEIMELCCAPTSDGLGIGCDNMLIVIVALLDDQRAELLEQWYDRVAAKIARADLLPRLGKPSRPYDEIYKELYGEGYLIGHQGDEPRRGARGDAAAERDADADAPDDDGSEGRNDGAISLQKLLASNAITNENGVIYLDTLSAQSLLAHFGMSGGDAEGDADADEPSAGHIEEVEEK